VWFCWDLARFGHDSGVVLGGPCVVLGLVLRGSGVVLLGCGFGLCAVLGMVLV
jgi:hypothetical protein